MNWWRCAQTISIRSKRYLKRGNYFKNVANGEPIAGKDVPIKRRDGSVFFGDITAAIMHLAGGPILFATYAT